MKRVAILSFIFLFIISVSSCADITDIYFAKNPDDRGVLYQIWNWLGFIEDNQFLYLIIMMSILFIIIKLFDAIKWFKNLFNKK